MAWHGGKGSSRRPEDRKKIDESWDRIFGLDKRKKDDDDKRKDDERDRGSQ